MSRPTHVPIRLCLGCGARAPQHELLRVFVAADGRLLVATGARAGRSGYLHRRTDCWERFAARQGTVRSLGCSVSKATRAACMLELKRLEQSAMMGER